MECPAGRRGVVKTDGRPYVCGRVVSRAFVKENTPPPSSPDDHLAACPDSSVKQARANNARSPTRRFPRVGRRIVPSARIRSRVPPKVVVVTAPDEHLRAGPHRRVKPPRLGAVGPLA